MRAARDATAVGLWVRGRVTKARALRVAGDYRQAAARLREAIAQAEIALGSDAMDLVLPLNELGMVGKLSEARAILIRVLAVYARDGARLEGEVAVTLHNLGGVDFREGRFAGAAGNLGRAAAIKRTVLGRRHPDLAITLYNLACCQRRLGRVGAARRNLRRVIRILSPAVAPDHPTLVACRRMLVQRRIASWAADMRHAGRGAAIWLRAAVVLTCVAWGAAGRMPALPAWSADPHAVAQVSIPTVGGAEQVASICAAEGCPGNSNQVLCSLLDLDL
ncbi:tetratricopeptide repeat protein [Streptosporangiaceae bacterium NEAU-GS5]|nr:tetratricopeptide repeat protein [Streptosporangiaceae bacterium NEAU-GS5]